MVHVRDLLSRGSVRALGVVLLAVGLVVSGYLLFRTLSLMEGAGGPADVCSTVFGRGCDATLWDPASKQLGIPVAGWGFEFTRVYACPGTLFLREQDGPLLVLLEDVDPTTRGTLELTATEGRTMRGRVEGEGAKYVGVERDRLYLGAPVRDDGTFEVEGVPNGVWKVTAFGEEGPLAAREGVPADAQDLVLRIPANER